MIKIKEYYFSIWIVLQKQFESKIVTKNHILTVTVNS